MNGWQLCGRAILFMSSYLCRETPFPTVWMTVTFKLSKKREANACLSAETDSIDLGATHQQHVHGKAAFCGKA
jgi:hypothetical protein